MPARVESLVQMTMRSTEIAWWVEDPTPVLGVIDQERQGLALLESCGGFVLQYTHMV